MIIRKIWLSLNINNNADAMENAITFCFALLIMLQMLVPVSMNICKGIDGQNCCDGYRRVQDKCIACEIGFYGTDCDKKCPYPTFGRDCQSLCNCIDTNCDHVKGCEQFLGENQIQSTTHISFKTVTKEQMTLDSNSTDEGVFNITSDNLTVFNSTICDTKKRQSKGINTIMFVIIGLAAVSFIIYMMYCYAPVFENRHLNTNTV